MSKYTPSDAAKDTGSSEKDTGKAWHDARNDAAKSGELEERNREKVSDSPLGSLLYDIFKGIFGG